MPPLRRRRPLCHKHFEAGLELPRLPQKHLQATARSELMAANIKVVEIIAIEIRALEHELDRQETAEKLRY
jgi:hypothetical protein